MFYAIQKEGGGLLPLDVRGRNKTHVEVGDYGPPRLFLSKRAAQNALTCWLMGIWHRGYDDMPEPMGTPKKTRDPALYSVVQVSLIVRPL